jgi:hypothetical protein
VAEKITHNSKCSNTKGNSSSSSSTKYYLSKLSNNPFPNIKFNNTSTKEIERIINSLKQKNSLGYDEISTKMLKVSAPLTSSSLSFICNKSILSATFPTQLKYSVVKPLFKKGDRNNVAIYGPIYLLTSFSKVFEKKSYMTDS